MTDEERRAARERAELATIRETNRLRPEASVPSPGRPLAYAFLGWDLALHFRRHPTEKMKENAARG